jgi:hypothetical protein
MKDNWGVSVQIYSFLTSALAGGEWSVSLPDHYTSGERYSNTHWIRGWVIARMGLDDEKREFLPQSGLELWPLGHLACGQLLFQLCCASSLHSQSTLFKSLHGFWLMWLKFVVIFISLWSQILGQYLWQVGWQLSSKFLFANNLLHLPVCSSLYYFHNWKNAIK